MSDPFILKISYDLNLSWTKRYVSNNKDIDNFKFSWNIMFMNSESETYTGNYIPPWSSVKNLISTFYFNLVGDSTEGSLIERRIQSSMKLHYALTFYLYDSMNGDKKQSLTDYLNQYDFSKPLRGEKESKGI